MTSRKCSRWNVVMFWGITAIYVSVTLFFLGIAALLFLGAPFWVFPNVTIGQMLGVKAPWSAIAMYGASALATLLLLAAHSALQRRKRGLGNRVYLLLGIVPLAITLVVCVLSRQLPRVPRQELFVVYYAAMDFLPFAGSAIALLVLFFLLRRFHIWSRPRLRALLLILLLMAGAYILIDPMPPRIAVGPWLQFAGERSMTVMWMTDRPAIAWVEYGDALEQRAPSSRYGLVDPHSRIHRATLSGLAPGARVSYRVAARKYHPLIGDPLFLAGETRSGTFTFGVPNPDSGSASFVVISDLHEHIEILPELLSAADVQDPDFVVFNGDIFSNVVNEYQLVTRFLHPVSQCFAAQTPFVFVRGNHDARGPFAKDIPDYLSLPGDPFLSSFRLGPASFLVLDTGEDKPDDDIEYQGLVDFTGWLPEEARRIEPLICTQAWRSAPFRVLLAHIPLQSGAGDYMAERLREARLDVQFAGHYHSVNFWESALGFPIIVASGMAWGNPDEFPAAVVTVNPARMDISLLTRTGTRTPFRQLLRADTRP